VSLQFGVWLICSTDGKKNRVTIVLYITSQLGVSAADAAPGKNDTVIFTVFVDNFQLWVDEFFFVVKNHSSTYRVSDRSGAPAKTRSRPTVMT